MSIKFKESYKHQTLEFLPGVTLSFEDPNAEDFFKRVGVAEDSSDPPVKTYSAEEIVIDEGTVFADGQRVLNAPDDGPGALERQGLVQPEDQFLTISDAAPAEVEPGA